MVNQINDGVRQRLKERVKKYGVRRLSKQTGLAPSTISGKLNGWTGMTPEEAQAWEKAMKS